ncbi:AAA family ATPase [Anaerolineales bacterium HSG25]|nr:AAA family ATPase [Anaerolineales bacterium HSG25]
MQELKINHLEEKFLQEYYLPDDRSDWFFRLFRVSIKKKYWLRPDYAWKGSQRVRTGVIQAFLHEKGSNKWGWKENYVPVLKKKLSRYLPLPTFELAVWLYRNQDWPQGTTPQDVLDNFFNQFNITEIEKQELFDSTIPQDIQNWLSEKPFSWVQLTEKLNIPGPEGIYDEGGTLSVLNIKGVGPTRNLLLNLAERVNLFTGDNGLGKSFLLECAYWALSGVWPGFQAYPRDDAERNEPKISFQILGSSGRTNKGESTYDWDLQQWSSQDERPTVPGLLIYARVDGAFAVWDPARDYWANNKTAYNAKPMIFSREEVWEGMQDKVGGKTTYISNGLITDWIFWQNSPEKETFETLKRVLKRLSPPGLEHGDLGHLEPGKPTRVPGDSRWMPTIKHSYGDVPLAYASAGVRRIVALAYLIVWAWTEHQEQSRQIRKAPQKRMVILVDEIEAHLHPKWQRRIVPTLLAVSKDLAPELTVQLLVATHSPLVMASIEPLFDHQKDKVFHLDLVKHDLFGSRVELHEIEFSIRGTADSWLRSDLFELSQPRSEEAEKAIEDAKKLQARDDVTTEEVREVSERLMKYLPTHGDRFWPRWTYFAEQHGVEL